MVLTVLRTLIGKILNRMSNISFISPGFKFTIRGLGRGSGSDIKKTLISPSIKYCPKTTAYLGASSVIIFVTFSDGITTIAKGIKDGMFSVWYVDTDEIIKTSI